MRRDNLLYLTNLILRYISQIYILRYISAHARRNEERQDAKKLIENISNPLTCHTSRIKYSSNYFVIRLSGETISGRSFKIRSVLLTSSYKCVRFYQAIPQFFGNYSLETVRKEMLSLCFLQDKCEKRRNILRSTNC